MIKPCKFEQATNFLGASMMDENNKLVPAPFHYYADGRFAVSCFELSFEDIQEIKRTGKIWVTAPFKQFPPISLQSENPFTPKIITTDALQKEDSTRDNEQHHNGDSKLFKG